MYWYLENERENVGDAPHLTKNFSKECMKITFCAKNLHLVCLTAHTVQILTVPIYVDDRIKDEYGQRIGETAEEDTKEAEINIQQKDKFSRTLDWGKRFGDSILMDTRFEAAKKAVKDEREARRRLQREDKPTSEVPPQVSDLNTMVDIYSSNSVEQDRLVFIIEEGINPSIILVGCYCSGLQEIARYSYQDLFKQSAAQNKRKVTFSNLKVHLDKVFDSEEVCKVDYFNREAKSGLMIVQRVLYFKYRLMLYCDSGDSVVWMRLKIKETDYFTAKTELNLQERGLEGIQEEFEERMAGKGRTDGCTEEFLKDRLGDDFRRLGYVKYRHEVMEANWEVIKGFGQDVVREWDGFGIQPKPFQFARSVLHNSQESYPPVVIKGRSLEEIDEHCMTRWGIRDIDLNDNFIEVFYWIDCNWFTKQIKMTLTANNRPTFGMLTRDKDKKMLEVMEESRARLKYSQERERNKKR